MDADSLYSAGKDGRSLQHEGLKTVTGMNPSHSPKQTALSKKWSSLYVLVVVNTAVTVLALVIFSRIFAA
jgi:hypothetical protein